VQACCAIKDIAFGSIKRSQLFAYIPRSRLAAIVWASCGHLKSMRGKNTSEVSVLLSVCKRDDFRC